MISIVAAVSKNGVIGMDNKLPWDSPKDLKRFKELTTNGVVIMGRKTYDSIGKPLPDRINIVISRDENLTINGVIVVNSLDNAILKSGINKDIFIIGGGEIYNQSINLVDKMYITEIEKDFDGDTTFPNIDLDKWVLDSKTKFKDGYFLTYSKNKILVN